MKVTADSLKQKSQKSLIIKQTVRDIIRAFEQDVTEACENHQQSCQLKLPTDFIVPGMTNVKAQLCIYNEVLKELESNGFHESINRDTKVWTVTGWEIVVDDKLNKEMVKRIASRMERPVYCKSDKSSRKAKKEKEDSIYLDDDVEV